MPQFHLGCTGPGLDSRTAEHPPSATESYRGAWSQVILGLFLKEVLGPKSCALGSRSPRGMYPSKGSIWLAG